METGNVYFESLYLDFKNSFAYFTNSNYSGRFSFEWIAEENETTLEGVFINIPTFFAICDTYDEIILSNNLEITSGNEMFKIHCFVDVFALPDFDLNNYNPSCALIDSELKEAISEASHFAGKESKLNGILIESNSIVSTDRYKIYEAKFENADNPRICLPSHFVSIFSCVEAINCFCKDGKLLMVGYVGDEKFFEIVGKEVELKTPPMKDPDFISRYNHPTFIIFKRIDILSVLKFMEPFVKGNINERLYLNITADKLLIEAKDEIKANRIIDLSECSSELIDSGVWVKRSDFQTAINVLSGENIKLQLDLSKPAFNLSGDGSKHIAFARMV